MAEHPERKKKMSTYGLCGERLGHSYSEIIHKMLGNNDYRLLNMTREEFHSFMTNRSFCAVNVTIPYKTDALQLCDVVSDEAKSIGSVNTVVNKNGTLYGYNTDISGFIYMLKRAGIDVCNKKVLILGTGGTSLTAQAACDVLGAREKIIVSRSGDINYQNIHLHSDAEIIINTTPVGMYPNNEKSPVTVADFPKLEGVADVIYNPGITKLLYDASKRGIKTAGGLSMLVYQAVEADRLFFGKEQTDNTAVVEKILDKISSDVRNIVLVGMPGCGKSTVGKIVAKKLGRTFIDADDYITEHFGRTPGEIISSDGEAAFRETETKALSEITKLSSAVISCGGGAVTREYNHYLIKQNSICFYITRDTEKLATGGRPLSAGGPEHLKKLFEARDPLYRAVADHIVSLTENSNKCANTIAERFISK